MSEWINVKDKLPEKTGDVLCHVLIPNNGRAAKRTRIISYHTYNKSWSCEGMIVTHWMPLPPPPEEAVP